jgi:hypothetical protein
LLRLGQEIIEIAEAAAVDRFDVRLRRLGVAVQPAADRDGQRAGSGRAQEAAAAGRAER